MDDSTLDTLLKQHFRAPSTDQLNQLERDVWRRIRLEETKPTLISQLQEWLAPLWMPQYRFAPVAVAMVIGLSASNIMHDFSVPQNSAAKMLSLNVFSVDYQKLPSHMIEAKL